MQLSHSSSRSSPRELLIWTLAATSRRTLASLECSRVASTEMGRTLPSSPSSSLTTRNHSSSRRPPVHLRSSSCRTKALRSSFRRRLRQLQGTQVQKRHSPDLQRSSRQPSIQIETVVRALCIFSHLTMMKVPQMGRDTPLRTGRSSTRST